jgi:hypothetical protein
VSHPCAPKLKVGQTRLGMRCLAALILFFTMPRNGWTHGIAGNRFFPGTLMFDDSAVADEFVITGFTYDHPFDANDVTDRTMNFAFARLLTDAVSVGFDTGFMRRNWVGAHQTGMTATNFTLKARIHRNELHESLISTSVTIGADRWGAKSVAASGPTTIQPGVFFGKGFGDLPSVASWLRPFGIAGALVASLPTKSTATNLTYDPTGQMFETVRNSVVPTLHSGIALEYSTFYHTSRFTPGQLPADEPLHQFIPLTEFAFDSRRGQKTTGSANPGVAHVAKVWQVAAEAVVPINHESGRRIGATVQVLFFLDDLAPSLFGHPLLKH